ncbi:MAG: DNRLRE domain-containing protein [Bacteroidota bacterium]
MGRTVILTKILRTLWLVPFLFGLNILVAQSSSSLAFLDGGKLSYTPFAMEGQSNAVNKIPDFSYAGYMKGGVPLPEVPVQITLEAQEGDNRASIQAAIDYVESLPINAQGIRGAVLLRKGIYEVNGILRIEESGVVLRGEGQGDNGTVLYATYAQNHDFLRIQGRSSGIQEDVETTTPISSAFVPVGSDQLVVERSTSFQVGDFISIKRTPNQLWIDTLQMAQYGWTAASYAIQHERVIKAIEGDTLTIDIPMVDVIDSLYGGGTISQALVTGRISQCGVEHLRIKSIYASNADEDHVWKAVRLRRCTDSWVKGVTAQYCGYACVSIENESNFNTIQDCAMIDQKSQVTGGRRYSFNISDGLGNLFQRCYTSEGRHDFVTSSRVTGPNVFLDCLAENTTNDIGPHHRWTTGTLFDNIMGGVIRVQNRGASGSGHGWAGAQTMFWNCIGTTIKVESALGSLNWGIGCEGTDQQGNGFWENWNQQILPRSLYLQQLEDRLGPQAVKNVALPEQLNGSIYPMLRRWAGESDLSHPQDKFSKRIKVIEDVHVTAGSSQNDNFGEEATLSSNTSTNTNATSEIYLKFDVSTINTVFDKALLRLKVAQNSGIPNQEVIYIEDDSWSESSLTWSNKKSESSSLGEFTSRTTDFWVEFDLSQQILSEVDQDGILSLKIKSKGNNQLVKFYSSEDTDSSNWPEIAIVPRLEKTEFTPIADTYVQTGIYSNDNFGSAKHLAVQASDSPGEEQISFLKFDLRGLNLDISRATLRLKVDSQQAHPYLSLWFIQDNSWAENRVTWNNQPLPSDSLSLRLTPGKGNYLEWDITQELNRLSEDSMLSFMLKTTDLNTFSNFFSKESDSLANSPQLLIENISTLPLLADSIDPMEEPPLRLSCFPNPFNEFCTIEFDLPHTGWVKIEVFDNQSRKLITLKEESFIQGKHSLVWENNQSFLPGLYFIRLSSEQGSRVKKVILTH